MSSFYNEEDIGMLRRGGVSATTSPCRRDYQLRSSSPTQLRDQCEISRPQSPWLPRSQGESDAIACTRRAESNPARGGRSKYYFSGPLPPAGEEGVARSSYYSGPLPSASPLPSYFSNGMTFASRQCSYLHQSAPEASSVSGRLPEVGSSRESSSSVRDDEGEDLSVAAWGDDEDDDVCEVGEVLYTSYLRKEDVRSAPSTSCGGRATSTLVVPTVGVEEQKAKASGRVMRNCVSAELGTGFELAHQRAQAARVYRSGEIVGLDIRADGIYPSSAMRSDVEALVKVGREISIRKQVYSSVAEPEPEITAAPSSETLAIVAVPSHERCVNSSDSAMVAIPFKWEEMPGNSTKRTTVFSRSSSSTSRTNARSDQQKVVTSKSQKGTEKVESSERWSENEIIDTSKPVIAPTSSRFTKSSSVSSKMVNPKNDVIIRSSAVPFKWEVEPGKPRVVEEKAETAPPLQLPPRLAATSSTKRSTTTTWSASAPSSRRNSTVSRSRVDHRQPSRSFSTSAAVSNSSAGRYFLPSSQDHTQTSSVSPPSSHDAKPKRTTLANVFRSSPLDNTGRPPIASQFGSPQYQTADYLCEDVDSVSWKNVRSPTSTLCGPGSGGDSVSDPSSCVSDKSSVSFSHSQSGTSAESFEQWSYGDHISPRSGNPSIRESEGLSRTGSVRDRHDEVGDHVHVDGTMSKLRRKLNLKRSMSSKPPMSPMMHSSHGAASARSVDANGYSSHGEEFFDCQGSGSSPFCDAKGEAEDEDEDEPPTRLPYKMPSPVHHDVKPTLGRSSPDPSSPPPTSRGGAEFSNCLGLTRFLSRAETQCLWVENPSWDSSDAPRNVAEDGYRSPAYKATLDLLSPLPNLVSKKSSATRTASKLSSSSSSSRRRQPHLVEVLCNSLKQSLQRCTKRSVARTQSIILPDDQFAKRHQSFMW